MHPAYSTGQDHTQDNEAQYAAINAVIFQETVAKAAGRVRCVVGHLMPSGFVFATCIFGKIHWSIRHGSQCERQPLAQG